MKERVSFKDKGGTGGTIKTVALLCIMAHALLVCVTHHHGNVKGKAADSNLTLRATTSDQSDDPTGTNGDSNCLSCRLQRNFVSDDQPASILIEMLPGPANSDTVFSEPHSYGPLLLLSDRAPPLV